MLHQIKPASEGQAPPPGRGRGRPPKWTTDSNEVSKASGFPDVLLGILGWRKKMTTPLVPSGDDEHAARVRLDAIFDLMLTQIALSG